MVEAFLGDAPFRLTNLSLALDEGSLGQGTTSDPDHDLDTDLWATVLQRERDEMYLKLPTFLMLGILMVIGVPGNLFVLAVYHLKVKHSAYRVFVLCMAAFDLVNCLVGIPFEMVDLKNDVTLDNAGACKFFRFVITFSACGSVSILVAVSLERFRRVCRPLGVQITVRQSWGVSGLSVLVALASSIPALVFYGVKTEERYGHRLYDCSIDDSWGTTSVAVFVYQVLLAAIWIFCIITLAIVYTFIIYTIKRQNERRKKLSDTNPPGQMLLNMTASGNGPGAAATKKVMDKCDQGRQSQDQKEGEGDVVHGETAASPAQNMEKHPTMNSSNNNSCNLSQNTCVGNSHAQTNDGPVATEEVTLNGLNAIGVQSGPSRPGEDSIEVIAKLPTDETNGNSTGLDGDAFNGRDELGSNQTWKNGKQGGEAAFMRLFSRDVNPLQQTQSANEQIPAGSVPIETLWEDEDAFEAVDNNPNDDGGELRLDCLVAPTPARCQIQGRARHLFKRQESLNNYYSSATHTPEGSIDGLSQGDLDCEDGRDQPFKRSTYSFKSWDAFDSSEEGCGSFQTLDKSGSLEGIRPLAGNLQKKHKTKIRGFEMAVASVKLHTQAANEGNNSRSSLTQSFSDPGSADVSKSSVSRAAQWGSVNALDSNSDSVADFADSESSFDNSGRKGKGGLRLNRGSVASGDQIGASGEVDLDTGSGRESRRKKLGHCGESTRLCVSEDLILENKSKASQCSVCGDRASLPPLTEELRREELGQFDMRRAASVPSLPSLPEVSTCGRQCRQRNATRTRDNQKVTERTAQTSEPGAKLGFGEIQSSKSNDAEGSTQTAHRQPHSPTGNVKWSASCVDKTDGDNSNTNSGTQRMEELQSYGGTQKSRKDSAQKSTNPGSPTRPMPNLSRRRTISGGREMLSTTKLTYTMLAVTLGFIISYLPHLSVQVIRGFHSSYMEEMLRTSPAFFALHHLFIRSFFVNNAINPIIYGFLNDTFKRKALSLLRSWAAAVLGEGSCGEKIFPWRCRKWTLRDFSQSSSHIDETG